MVFETLAQNPIRIEYFAEYKEEVIIERMIKLKEERQNSLINISFFRNYYKEQQDRLQNSEIILRVDRSQYKLTFVSPMSSDRSYISPYNPAALFFDAELIYGNLESEIIYLAGIEGNLEIDRVFYLNEVEWELTNETKTIIGYTCYKAVGHLKEKDLGNYRQFPVTAWYAPDLSYQGGPTQYVNLPGLILEFETQISSVKATSIDFGDFKIKPYVPQYKVMTYAKFIQRRDSLDKIYRPRQD